MLSLLSWAIVGLVSGLIARALYPGHQGYGTGITILLGIGGALLGGYLAAVVLGINVVAGSFSLPALMFSVLGAMLIIFIFDLLVTK